MKGVVAGIVLCLPIALPAFLGAAGWIPQQSAVNHLRFPDPQEGLCVNSPLSGRFLVVAPWACLEQCSEEGASLIQRAVACRAGSERLLAGPKSVKILRAWGIDVSHAVIVSEEEAAVLAGTTAVRHIKLDSAGCVLESKETDLG